MLFFHSHSNLEFHVNKCEVNVKQYMMPFPSRLIPQTGLDSLVDSLRIYRFELFGSI